MRFLLVILASSLLLFPSYGSDTLKDKAISYCQEGYKLQLKGDLRGAILYYQKAIQLNPHFTEAYNDLGIVYESLDDQNSALAMYKRALEIDNYYLPAYTNLAFLYEKKGDFKKAGYYWMQRYKLGGETGYWSELAVEHLHKLGLSSQVKEVAAKRAVTKLEGELAQRRQKEKQRIAEEASKHLRVGSGLLKAKKYSQALKEFETALSLEPADKELKKKLTDSYEKAKKIYLKRKILRDTKEASNYIKKNDYFSAGEKLKDALSAVFSIVQEEE